MKKILLIEKSDSTFILICGFLDKIGYDRDLIVRCNSQSEMFEVDPNDILIVLMDMRTSDRFYVCKLPELKYKFQYTPIIVFTDTTHVSEAIAAIRSGIQDYLILGEFDDRVLQKSIQYAIERKRNESDYKRLFKENPSPMFIYERDTYKYLAVNNAALDKYGYSYEEFLNMTACDIRPAEDLEAFRQINTDVPENYVDVGRWRHCKKNGDVFFVHIYAHCTEFEGKKAMMIQAADIDTKVKTEQALKKKNGEVENILESITDGFYALDHEWRFTYINKEFERMLKRKREDLIGKNIWKEFPETKSLKLYNEFNRVITERTSVHFEEFYAPVNMWTSVKAYPTKDGIAVYFVDITEQKAMQDQIFIDEQNLRSIINNTKDIIWSIDADMNLISANQAYHNRTSHITGKLTIDITEADYDPGTLNTWRKYYNEAFKGKAFKEIITVGHGNSTIYEEVSFNPIYSKCNEVIGISCFSRDITEQRTYQRKIEKQNEQLREISWIQSHKVRGPLASILGLVNLINTDTVDHDKSELIELLKQAAEMLDAVIKEVVENANRQID